MMIRSLLFLATILTSVTRAQANPVFDPSLHCIKDSGLYTGCTKQVQGLNATFLVSSKLSILNKLPQKWRLGYRFYCSAVSGFGELEAKLILGEKSIGLTRTKEPKQQELTLFLEGGVNPNLEVGTSKRGTRLAEDCRFELTSVTVAPLTETIDEIFRVISEKKSIVDFLKKVDVANSSMAALGFLEARKVDWTSKLQRIQKLIDLYQLKRDALPSGDERRQGFDIKLAEQSKAKALYEEELNALVTDLVTLNSKPAQCSIGNDVCSYDLTSLKSFAERLDQSYHQQVLDLSEYLDHFELTLEHSDAEILAVQCGLNVNNPLCGE